MLTPVERVLILKGADLLKDVGPRHLLGLADVAREIEIAKGDTLYEEGDPADALYMVVEGRVRLSTGGRTTSEVGPGQAFGTWALVDDSRHGQRAVCIEDGLALALRREDFYDRAASDLTLLQEVVRVLAKRLRALVSDRPEEARVEDEGIEKPPEEQATPEAATAPTPGAALEAAALGQNETAAPSGERPPAKPGEAPS
jgi:CRP-like cAMP-binding protein